MPYLFQFHLIFLAFSDSFLLTFIYVNSYFLEVLDMKVSLVFPTPYRLYDHEQVINLEQLHVYI